MKSYEDDLNDAIQKAFQDSFKDFEKKPKASIDQKIYKALLNKPFWQRPVVIWSAAGLLLILGLGLFEMPGHYLPFQYEANFKSNRHQAISKRATGHHQSNRSIRSNTLPNAFKTDSASKKLVETATGKKTLNAIHTSNTHITFRVQTKQNVLLNANDPAPQVRDNSSGKVAIQAVIDKPQTANNSGFAAEPERSGEIAVQDQVAKNSIVKPLPTSNVMPIPVALGLPEIGHAVVGADVSALKGGAPQSVRKKLDIRRYDQSGLKSYSWLFNVAATNTFQTIYLLPSAESRILKVSFPNSITNLGYKFSAGIQTLGSQVTLHYSHLTWKAEYVYAIDEFKADDAGTKQYVFERLGTAETITSKLDMVGIGLKKQLDFKSRHLGRIFGQLGLDYSRSLQSNAQNFVSGVISAGKIIQLDKKTDLMIGPYFAYNFKKVPTADYSIKVRPNQLGVSVGLRFKKAKMTGL